MGRFTSHWARRVAVLLLLGALAACNRSAPPPAQTGFRNAEALIGATSRYDAARFGGDWQVRAAFPNDANLRVVTFAPQGPTLIEHRQSCDAAGICTDRRDLWALSEEGPARYTMRAAVGGAERALCVRARVKSFGLSRQAGHSCGANAIATATAKSQRQSQGAAHP